ncbi:MAG: DsbA family protein, partial [Pseudomonadota bacterium]
MADATSALEPPHFLYIVDPMCSWCYGFSGVIAALAAQFEGRLPVRINVGGLRAGNTRAMSADDKAYIKGAWQRVGEASGRSFDFAFFEREGFVYDTEPACRAVVTMRTLAPERALSFVGVISQAFYGANQDTTDADVLADLAREHGVDRTAFAETFIAPDTRNATFHDFLTAQQMGVHGFPTLLAKTGQGYQLVTNGFRPLEALADPLER